MQVVEPRSNHLLDILPLRERQRCLAACISVDLAYADVLSNPGEPIRHIYFPTSCIISLSSCLGLHDRLGVALIGNEGLLGANILLGVETSPLRAVVQGFGEALRMDVAPFNREIKQSVALQKGLKRYLYVEMCQFAQSAACNRFHFVLARLARWLLMTQDRAQSMEFHVTHEFLAQMLGVRRVGVTRAATLLQRDQLIRYRRGQITILDRHGLEGAACGCYQTDKANYAYLKA